MSSNLTFGTRAADRGKATGVFELAIFAGAVITIAAVVGFVVWYIRN